MIKLIERLKKLNQTRIAWATIATIAAALTALALPSLNLTDPTVQGASVAAAVSIVASVVTIVVTTMQLEHAKQLHQSDRSLQLKKDAYFELRKSTGQLMQVLIDVGDDTLDPASIKNRSNEASLSFQLSRIIASPQTVKASTSLAKSYALNFLTLLQSRSELDVANDEHANICERMSQLDSLIAHFRTAMLDEHQPQQIKLKSDQLEQILNARDELLQTQNATMNRIQALRTVQQQRVLQYVFGEFQDKLIDFEVCIRAELGESEEESALFRESAKVDPSEASDLINTKSE